jgi:hypothetical protein
MLDSADNEHMILLLSMLGIGVVGLLSSRFGADSRPGFDESEPLN